jgi:NADH-quinone oxidoreductase subunit H
VKRVRVFLPFLLALAVLVLLLSTARRPAADAPTPNLVRVREIVPREVEPGDRLAILGDGFILGRPARLSFRGTLHRPGEPARRGVEIVVGGIVVAPERIDLALDDRTQSLFCDIGDRAKHATFEGELEVAFAPVSPGSPPIAGVLDHALLDVRPGFSPSLTERETEGERLLGWVGIGWKARSTGLIVEGVEPGSRAERARMAPGDVIESFDGLRVASPADVVPPPGATTARVGVRAALGDGRGDTPDVVRTLRVDGFRRAPAVRLLGLAVCVLSALAVVFLFGAPAHPAVVRVLQRVVSREVESPELTSRSPAPPAAEGRAVTAAGEVVVLALVAATPLAPSWLVARVDVVTLFVAAAGVLVAAALATGSGSAWQRARAAARVACLHLPLAAALGSVVVLTGSVRVAEVVRMQGGWPWEWVAFRSPASLVSCALLLWCARIDPDSLPRPPGLRGLLEIGGFQRASRPWLEAVCQAHRTAMAALASALFLGGWLVPGLAMSGVGVGAREGSGGAIALAAAGCFLAKTWALSLAITRAARHRRGPAVAIAGATLLGLGGAAAWIWWNPPPATQLLVSAALVAVVGLGAVALVYRIYRMQAGLLSGARRAQLNTFL